ncbi:MAG TPA: hypothetical protein VNW50_22475 [Streptosporangiaceae bacterium]|jgi:hypothetical protein|nr:hypothetical protein [Streptosporangiaceae bacterium]
MEPSERVTPAAVQELLTDPDLAREWILDPSRSVFSLQARSMLGMARVNGVFRHVTGGATVSPTCEVTGRLTPRWGRPILRFPAAPGRHR